MRRIIVGFMLVAVIGVFPSAEAFFDDVPALLKDLKSKNFKTRASAAEAIGKLGAVRATDAKDAIPLFIDMVKKDREPSVRKAATEALGRVDPDPKTAVPVLLGALKDKDVTVRQAAAAALGRFPAESETIVPALKEAGKDKNKMVEQAAKMALRNLNEQKKQQ
jgi:HEAT repeat protein